MAESKSYDSLIHAKSSNGDGGLIEKKEILPVTRWENVVGSPRTVTPEQLKDAYVADYLWYLLNGYMISAEEYNNCYGDL